MAGITRHTARQGVGYAIAAGAILSLTLAAPARSQEQGRDRAAPPPHAPKADRSWGVEQATGAPDSPQGGDTRSAWASRTADGQAEWLVLGYSQPVVPRAIAVYETFNPGALRKVTVFRTDGSEVEVWSGTDPTPPGADKGISIIPVKVDFPVQRVKLHLDSAAVPGWNEIDAVGVRDDARQTHWAVAAEASSTYGDPQPAPVVAPVPAPETNPAAQQRQESQIQAMQQRVKELEDERRGLLKMIEELKGQLEVKPKER